MSKTPFTMEPPCSCLQKPSPPKPDKEDKNWNRRYYIKVSAIAVIWWVAYSSLEAASNWLVFQLFGFTNLRFGASLTFFVYDTLKIFMLLGALIYVIAWLRASMDTNKIRHYLAGKRRLAGYFLGALFGAITPFCSCSSIPLFLGFTSSRIPIGISMAFLITSPLINEIAIVLLWGLLGWKFTICYIIIGMTAGVFGGFVMDVFKADRWLQPLAQQVQKTSFHEPFLMAEAKRATPTIRWRHEFAYAEMRLIVKRVWKWVILGVGIGAGLHGFVPENWFAEHFSADEWWTVPASVVVAIPLYSNVTGIIPVMESLLIKGLPIGTTMAFCMSAVVVSIPEFIMLRQIMRFKLQGFFILYLWVTLTLAGWFFNSVEYLLR